MTVTTCNKKTSFPALVEGVYGDQLVVHIGDPVFTDSGTVRIALTNGPFHMVFTLESVNARTLARLLNAAADEAEKEC